MKTLKKILRKFESVMVAVAFAEAGEFETAREIYKERESEKNNTAKKLDKRYLSDYAVHSVDVK
jgi:hypothetical protein